MYGSTILSKALRQRGLSSKPSHENKVGRILIQNGREVGPMTASVGWALVRLIDGTSLDDVPRCDVTAARKLYAGLDR